MPRPRTLAALLSLAALLLTLPLSAASREAEVEGTVISFDQQAQILNVNTRLGAKSFLVTNTTLIFLNNHTTNANSMTAGDVVTVRYNYDTSTATEILITRELGDTGRIVSASGANISLRLSDGLLLGLHTDAGSQVSLGGLPVTNAAVLVNRKAKVVYEPGTFLILSLAARSELVHGRITASDTTAKTITVTAAKSRVMKLDAAANIARSGAAATQADLVVGDHARVAYVRNKAGFRALIIRANPTAP
jgi:hypothetical protein